MTITLALQFEYQRCMIELRGKSTSVHMRLPTATDCTASTHERQTVAAPPRQHRHRKLGGCGRGSSTVHRSQPHLRTRVVQGSRARYGRGVDAPRAQARARFLPVPTHAGSNSNQKPGKPEQAIFIRSSLVWASRVERF